MRPCPSRDRQGAVPAMYPQNGSAPPVTCLAGMWLLRCHIPQGAERIPSLGPLRPAQLVIEPSAEARGNRGISGSASAEKSGAQKGDRIPRVNGLDGAGAGKVVGPARGGAAQPDGDVSQVVEIHWRSLRRSVTFRSRGRGCSCRGAIPQRFSFLTTTHVWILLLNFGVRIQPRPAPGPSVPAGTPRPIMPTTREADREVVESRQPPPEPQSKD